MLSLQLNLELRIARSVARVKTLGHKIIASLFAAYGNYPSLGLAHGTCRPSREDATPPPSLKLLGGGGVSERGGKMDLQVHESGK